MTLTVMHQLIGSSNNNGSKQIKWGHVSTQAMIIVTLHKKLQEHFTQGKKQNLLHLYFVWTDGRPVRSVYSRRKSPLICCFLRLILYRPFTTF